MSILTFYKASNRKQVEVQKFVKYHKIYSNITLIHVMLLKYEKTNKKI